MTTPITYVLVTGATGFIGAHIVDNLLKRGLKVRCATRSASKGALLIKAREEYASQLDVVMIEDFANERSGETMEKAIRDVDAVIHVASPLSYTPKSNEQDLILPAINGVKALFTASTSPHSKIQRIVLTSSFASILDVSREAPPYFTYTSSDWNPLTYATSISPTTSPVIAYRGSKKFAELEAWNFVKENKPRFDLVTLCPPMTFGPIVHPINKVEELNESNMMLWKVARGDPLPVARVPFWVDVRDLAEAHAEALLRPEAGGKRYVPTSPERFSYSLVAEIILKIFEWAEGRVVSEEQEIDESYGLDGVIASRELGFEYRNFQETVIDLAKQAVAMRPGV